MKAEKNKKENKELHFFLFLTTSFLTSSKKKYIRKWKKTKAMHGRVGENKSGQESTIAF